MLPDGIILVSTFALILTVSESVSPILTSPLRVEIPVTTKPAPTFTSPNISSIFVLGLYFIPSSV